jgi:transcriptional regulator with XRE-family HTH domain
MVPFVSDTPIIYNGVPIRQGARLTLAERIKACMEQKGDRRVADVARRTGIAYGTIHPIISGKQTAPRVETLQVIARSYGVSVDWLLGREEGNGAGGGAREETPEDAIVESEVTHALRIFDRVIRASGGSAQLSHEERQRLLVPIILDEVEDWREKGWDVRPLLDRLEEVRRGSGK